MYPTLFDALRDILGIEIQGFRFINTFGFFVALAFFVAFYVSRQGLKWREQKGFLPFIEQRKIIGKKVSFLDVFFYFIFGFAFGYKIIGIFSSNATNSYMYLISADGSWLGGLLLGGLFAYAHYRTKKKEELAKPEEKVFHLPVHSLMENALLICLVAGIVGAKLFHNLENFGQFMDDPIGSLFSFSGLTFYGGLICSTLALYWYVRRYDIDFFVFADALCVGVLMAYGVGRLGCHFAGDGDWGIVNLTTNPIPFLPDWWWAYSYPNNVLGIQLDHPVFPTPLYEAIVCILLAFLLGVIGKKIKIPGVLFGIYFIVVGLERLLIEQIRVNSIYSFLEFSVTQAELISIILILFGGLLIYFRKRIYKRPISHST